MTVPASIMRRTRSVVPIFSSAVVEEILLVADDDVQSSEAFGVRVRLVAGVDDRS